MTSNFCSRPFNEMHIEENGNVTPCCVMPSNRFFMGKGVREYFYGNELKVLKEELLDNKKPDNCEYCWSAESVNLKTHRINNSAEGIHQMHIRLNNVCNFKCRMCNPKFSSTWEIENRKHRFFQHEYSTQKDVFDYDPKLLPFIVKLAKSNQLHFLNISGGEPLITDAHYKLLTYLLENGAHNLILGYSTNLSNLTYKNIDLMSLWSKFHKVLIEASCDGWGEAVEYSRTGFKRETFMTNFVKAHKYINRINCVVNIYSVWTLPFIEKLCDKFKVNPVYSPCFLPEFLNPQHLYREDKEDLQKLYEPYPRLQQVFNDYIDGYKVSLGKEMCEYNLMLDSYRGTDFFKTFPQYRKYHDTCS